MLTHGSAGGNSKSRMLRKLFTDRVRGRGFVNLYLQDDSMAVVCIEKLY
jgi:hypothetical protein